MVRPAVFRRSALLAPALLFALLFPVPAHAQETVAVDLTITNVTLAATGDLVVTTNITCAEPAEAFVRADASQQVGRTLVFGSGEASTIVACDPAGTTVTVLITPQVGAFRPGPGVNVVAVGAVCAPDFAICSATSFDSHEQTVRVRRTP